MQQFINGRLQELRKQPVNRKHSSNSAHSVCGNEHALLSITPSHYSIHESSAWIATAVTTSARWTGELELVLVYLI